VNRWRRRRGFDDNDLRRPVDRIRRPDRRAGRRRRRPGPASRSAPAARPLRPGGGD